MYRIKEITFVSGKKNYIVEKLTWLWFKPVKCGFNGSPFHSTIEDAIESVKALSGRKFSYYYNLSKIGENHDK